MKYEPWDSLDKKGKKERVILIGLIVALVAFSPIWEHFHDQYVEKKIAEQEKSLKDDILGTVNSTSDTINSTNKIIESIESEQEELEKQVEIEDQEETDELEGDSLDTEVEKK